MNSLRYTNTLLTIIAGCLLVMVGDKLGLIPKASAAQLVLKDAVASTPRSESPLQRVVIAGIENDKGEQVRLPLSFTSDGSLRVADTLLPITSYSNALRVVTIN